MLVLFNSMLIDSLRQPLSRLVIMHLSELFLILYEKIGGLKRTAMITVATNCLEYAIPFEITAVLIFRFVQRFIVSYNIPLDIHLLILFFNFLRRIIAVIFFIIVRSY